MRLILRYPNGMRVEALLLSRDEVTMRIVMRGREETLELRLLEGHWHDEAGARLSIEAMLSRPDAYTAPLTRAAGASPVFPEPSGPARSRYTVSE